MGENSPKVPHRPSLDMLESEDGYLISPMSVNAQTENMTVYDEAAPADGEPSDVLYDEAGPPTNENDPTYDVASEFGEQKWIEQDGVLRMESIARTNPLSAAEAQSIMEQWDDDA